MSITTWLRQRRLDFLRAELAGEEAELAELERIGYGSAYTAGNVARLKYRIASLEKTGAPTVNAKHDRMTTDASPGTATAGQSPNEMNP